MSENPRPSARTPLTPRQISEALSSLPDWRHRQFGLFTAYRCETSATAVELLGRIGALAEELNHHPDVDWRYDHVFIGSASHDVGGAVTIRDLRLAGRITEAAAELGVAAVPERNRSYEIAIDTTDPQALTDFWCQAMGYTPDERTGNLTDPYSRGPSVWFQETEQPDPRPMHVDVTLPRSGIDQIRDALAGSRLREGTGEDDRFAPRWWIYADADGNRVCLCSGEVNLWDTEDDPADPAG